MKNRIDELVDRKLNLIKGDIPKKGLTKFSSTTRQADEEMSSPPSYYTGYFRFGRSYPMLDVNIENEKNYREIQDDKEMNIKTETKHKKVKNNNKIDKLINKYISPKEKTKVTEDVYSKPESDSDILPKSDVSIVTNTNDLETHSPAVVYKTKELIEAINAEGVVDAKLKMVIMYEIMKALDLSTISRRDKSILANKLMTMSSNGEIVEDTIKNK
jgi:hypothetical protein